MIVTTNPHFRQFNAIEKRLPPAGENFALGWSIRGRFSPCFISSETMYCMTSRVMKKILNPHSTYSSRNPQMILPIKPQELQNPKQKKTLTLTLTKPHKVKKKKSFANCACEIPFHQLAVLDIYFRGFYPYEKKCKVCCMCFFTPVTMR